MGSSQSLNGFLEDQVLERRCPDKELERRYLSQLAASMREHCANVITRNRRDSDSARCERTPAVSALQNTSCARRTVGPGATQVTAGAVTKKEVRRVGRFGGCSRANRNTYGNCRRGASSRERVTRGCCWRSVSTGGGSRGLGPSQRCTGEGRWPRSGDDRNCRRPERDFIDRRHGRSIVHRGWRTRIIAVAASSGRQARGILAAPSRCQRAVSNLPAQVRGNEVLTRLWCPIHSSPSRGKAIPMW